MHSHMQSTAALFHSSRLLFPLHGDDAAKIQPPLVLDADLWSCPCQDHAHMITRLMGNGMLQAGVSDLAPYSKIFGFRSAPEWGHGYTVG